MQTVQQMTKQADVVFLPRHSLLSNVIPFHGTRVIVISSSIKGENFALKWLINRDPQKISQNEILELTFQPLAVSLRTTRFNIQKFYIALALL